MPSHLASIVADLPEGYSEVHFRGRKYGLTKQTFNSGRSFKVYAEELGGQDFVSLNLYLTKSGALVKPCEMPLAKVEEFLTQFRL